MALGVKLLKSLNERIGENIRDLRKSKGFKSQEAFAEALGIGRTAVARWELGLFKPSNEMLARVCDVLGVSVSEIIGGPKTAPERTPVETQIEALVGVISEQSRQIEALQAQIQAMQPKPSDGKGRESTGVYQYTKDTIVSKSQPRRSKESQGEDKLLEIFRALDDPAKEDLLRHAAYYLEQPGEPSPIERPEADSSPKRKA